MELKKLLEQNKFPDRKFHLTKQGLEKIKKEHEQLLEIKNRKTRGEAPAIFHSEDLNPEYLAFFEDLDLLKVRISDLEHILKNAELIKTPPKKEQGAVGLGAKVLVQIDGVNDDTFEIVGTLEANPALGKISNESPVGKAFLGRKAGEDFIISSPIKTTYKIKKIIYPRN